jgi:hypothetical protein
MKRIKYHSPTNKPVTHARPRWLIPAVLVGLGALIVGGILFVVASSQPFTPQVTGRPSGVVSQNEFTYGDIKLGKTVETVFKVKNVGDENLHILNDPYVEVVEGCCPPTPLVSSRIIRPGEEATVTIQFMMHEGMGGYHNFLAHVLTDDPVEPDKQVRILSNWVE